MTPRWAGVRAASRPPTTTARSADPYPARTAATRRGRPPVRWYTSEARAGSTSSATSPGVKGARGSVTAPYRPRPARRIPTSCGAGDRTVPMTVTGVPPEAVPTWARRSSDAASAQCRSSSTTASGPASISASLICASAANRAEAAAAGSMSGSSAISTPARRSAARQGHSGGAGSAGQYPRTTGGAAASRTAWSTRVVLPTPAGPLISRTPLDDRSWAARWAARTPSSRSRPTNTAPRAAADTHPVSRSLATRIQ